MVALKEISPASLVECEDYNRFAEKLSALPFSEAEATCTFTPGLMTRRAFMKAGSLHLSKRHASRHQFVILQGAALVSENGGPQVLMVAPWHGVTEPGTWRKLFILMDSVWLTMHPTDKTTVEEVEADIIRPMEEVLP